jgi:hypothetical protein
MSSNSEQRRREQVEPDKRLVDPDNYNLRRRLRQIHDAREYVKEVKNEALGRNLANSGRNEIDPDPAVAEAVTDYADELLPILRERGRAEVFLEEDLDDVDATLGEFLSTRGQLSRSRAVPYTVSMQVWRLCNQYFENVAGPEFEDENLPKEIGFETTGAADDE